MKGLWKSTIIIWSAYDPSEVDIEELAREALTESAHCSEHKIEFIDDLENDPDWDGSDFFVDI